MSNIIIRTKTIKGIQHHYLLNDEAGSNIENLFSRQWLKEKGLIFAEAKGRAIATMFNWESKQYVLKKYCRGGLPAKFSKDKYFFRHLKETRVFKEFELLKIMHQKGLPVSTPCYAEVIKKGLFYQAKIISEYIADSKSLADIIEKQEMPLPQWAEIGRIIKQFHNQQIYHDDLNACNILLVGNKVYLIDFDQSEIKKGNDWKIKNLARLKRSLLKIKNKVAVFNFDESNWQALLGGYQTAK